MPLKTPILRGEVRSPVYGPLSGKWGSEAEVITGPGAGTGEGQGLLLVLTKD